MVSMFIWSLVLSIGLTIRPTLASNPIVFGHYSFFATALLFSAVIGMAALVAGMRWFRRLIGTPNRLGLRQSFVFAVAVNVLSSLWVLVASAIISLAAIRERVISPDANVLWEALLIFLPIIWHAVTITVFLWRGYPSAVVAGMIILAVINLNVSVGGATLRLMGIGGGIPIAALVRFPEVSSGTPPLRRIQGCLVMWLGNQISIQIPQDSSPISYCHLSPLTPIVENGTSVPTAVHTLTRADIVDVYSIGIRHQSR
jgi:hypothetical protein